MQVKDHAEIAARSIANIETHRDTPAEVRKARLSELRKSIAAAEARIDAATEAAVQAELEG